MPVHIAPSWALAQSQATPRDHFLSRRQLVAGLAAAGLVGARSDLATGDESPTLPYNGYGEQFARLYTG